MEYTPKDMKDLLDALEGKPGEMSVEADADTEVAARTVNDLRDLPFWRGGLVIVVPRENAREKVIKVRKSE